MEEFLLKVKTKFNPKTKYEEVLLEKVKYALGMRLNDETIEDCGFPEVELVIEKKCKELAFTLKAAVLKENLGNVELSYPATWWQHFKLDYFPDFLKRKYPVKRKTVKYSVDALYPYFKPSLENEYRAVLRAGKGFGGNIDDE